MDEWVVANRDFTYNKKDVRRGQAFQLEGCRNDGALLRHQLVSPLTEYGFSDPDEGDVEDLPMCGQCGRHFAKEWQRDRCGRMHERTAADLQQERLEVSERVKERVETVGA